MLHILASLKLGYFRHPPVKDLAEVSTVRLDRTAHRKGYSRRRVLDMALEAMHSEIAAIRAVASEAKQGQRDNIIMFGFGFIAAALMFLLLIVLAWLYSGG